MSSNTNTYCLLRPTVIEDIQRGTILREVVYGDRTPQYGDTVVVRVVREDGDNGEMIATLARAHMSVDASGWSVRVEEFKAPVPRLVGEASIFRTLLTSRDEPASVCYEKGA